MSDVRPDWVDDEDAVQPVCPNCGHKIVRVLVSYLLTIDTETGLMDPDHEEEGIDDSGGMMCAKCYHSLDSYGAEGFYEYLQCIWNRGLYKGMDEESKTFKPHPVYSQETYDAICEQITDLCWRLESCIGQGNGEMPGDRLALYHARNLVGAMKGETPNRTEPWDDTQAIKLIGYNTTTIPIAEEAGAIYKRLRAEGMDVIPAYNQALSEVNDD